MYHPVITHELTVHGCEDYCVTAILAGIVYACVNVLISMASPLVVSLCQLVDASMASKHNRHTKYTHS